MNKEYIHPQVAVIATAATRPLCMSYDINGAIDGPVGAPRLKLNNADFYDDGMWENE